MSKQQCFNTLEELYQSMPATTCLKSECSNWCCSKLDSFVDENGNFMPLPLVYGIEYLYILNFLKAKYGNQDLSEIFNFSKDVTLCPFKDKESSHCLIYPVRPFSCRVYGRKVPPVFWGVNVSIEQANAVYCKNLAIDEPEKQLDFMQNYPKMWNVLAKLSFENSPFADWQKTVFVEQIGSKDILVFAFGEFYFLTRQTFEWYKKYFLPYWNIMGNKL